MIVCSCKAVSEKTIAALAAAGADSVEAIGGACGAGTDCGSCHDQIAEIVEEAAPASCPGVCKKRLAVLPPRAA